MTDALAIYLSLGAVLWLALSRPFLQVVRAKKTETPVVIVTTIIMIIVWPLHAVFLLRLLRRPA